MPPAAFGDGGRVVARWRSPLSFPIGNEYLPNRDRALSGLVSARIGDTLKASPRRDRGPREAIMPASKPVAKAAKPIGKVPVPVIGDPSTWASPFRFRTESPIKGSAGSKLDAATETQRDDIRLVLAIVAMFLDPDTTRRVLDTLIFFMSSLRSPLVLEDGHEGSEKHQSQHRRGAIVRSFFEVPDDYELPSVVKGACEACSDATAALTGTRDSARGERDGKRAAAVEAMAGPACVAVVARMPEIDWSEMIGTPIVWSQEGLPTLAKVTDEMGISGLDPIHVAIAGVCTYKFGIMGDTVTGDIGKWDFLKADRSAVRSSGKVAASRARQAAHDAAQALEAAQELADNEASSAAIAESYAELEAEVSTEDNNK